MMAKYKLRGSGTQLTGERPYSFHRYMPNLAQVGVLERIRVFQAIVKHPIQAGMAEHEQSRKLQPRHLPVTAEDKQHDRYSLVMGKIISPGAWFGAKKIAEHTEVGGQKENEEPPPGVIQSQE